jgi:hypothetical protein
MFRLAARSKKAEGRMCEVFHRRCMTLLSLTLESVLLIYTYVRLELHIMVIPTQFRSACFAQPIHLTICG